MSRARFKGLNTEIAYPWPVEAIVPEDITGIDMSEVIYGPGADDSGVIGSFILGWHELGDEI